MQGGSRAPFPSAYKHGFRRRDVTSRWSGAKAVSPSSRRGGSSPSQRVGPKTPCQAQIRHRRCHHRSILRTRKAIPRLRHPFPCRIYRRQESLRREIPTPRADVILRIREWTPTRVSVHSLQKFPIGRVLIVVSPIPVVGPRVPIAPLVQSVAIVWSPVTVVMVSVPPMPAMAVMMMPVPPVSPMTVRATVVHLLHLPLWRAKPQGNWWGCLG